MNYLEYVNKVLNALNEIPLTEATFGLATGPQSFAKDAINDTYSDIVREKKWPWMKPDQDDTTLGNIEITGERSLVPTGVFTNIPGINPYKDVLNWNTISYEDAEGEIHSLISLSFEAYENLREHLSDTGEPKYIIQSADGLGMGLSPYPGEVGKLVYTIYGRTAQLSLATQILELPDRHSTVLTDGALARMGTYFTDAFSANSAGKRYDEGILLMKHEYISVELRMRGRR